MRIMVIILSSFATLILVEPSALPLHLALLAASGVRTAEASGCLGLFSAWALATALVYSSPVIAGWLFVVAGIIGLYVGTDIGYPVLSLWGCLAFGLALLTVWAYREKCVADHLAWQREQLELAVHLAMRSLQETVPELLARVPDGDRGDLLTARAAALTPSAPDPGMVRRRHAC
jgi:hypothetical protein